MCVEAKATSAPSGLHEGSTAVLESATRGTGSPAPRVRMKRPARPRAVETNTSRSPAGAQLGLASIDPANPNPAEAGAQLGLASIDPANPNPAVSGTGLVPSAAHSHSLGTPLSSLRYAMCRPSGESAGWVSFAAVVVRRRAAPPVAGTAYSSALPSR